MPTQARLEIQQGRAAFPYQRRSALSQHLDQLSMRILESCNATLRHMHVSMI